MAKNYKPSAPFNVAMKLLKPTTDAAFGVGVKHYTTPEASSLIYGSFRTFGGTESTDNGIYTIIDTATVDTWYRPDITADCQIYICESGQTYDIISDPEDIDFRHQYCQFRVRKAGGKA